MPIPMAACGKTTDLGAGQADAHTVASLGPPQRLATGAVRPGQLDIVGPGAGDPLPQRRVHLANDPPGHAHHQRPRWHDNALRNDCPRGYYASTAYPNAV